MQMNDPVKKENKTMLTIPTGSIPHIASAAEKIIPGSGAAVTVILSNLDTINDALAKVGHSLFTEKNKTPVSLMTSQPNTTTPKVTIDSIANAAKSSNVKDAARSALALAAKNPQAVATAANSVAPGSGVVILPLLKAYNIPGVKQVMNFLIDKKIDLEVDKAALMAKSESSPVTSKTRFRL